MMNKLTRRRILFNSAGMAIRLANGWKVQKMKMTALWETGDRPS